MALQVCVSLLMPSRPSASPARWMPVTCSRPSRCVRTVFSEPERTAYRLLNGSPERYSVAPRLTVCAVQMSASSFGISSAERPWGRHKWRMEQLEQLAFLRTAGVGRAAARLIGTTVLAGISGLRGLRKGTTVGVRMIGKIDVIHVEVIVPPQALSI